MAKKREKIKLKCAESSSYVYTEKNKTNTPDRITLRKFCPKLRKHVEYKETK
mgnify:CR=1 FL=1|jgi:large subunit ribosomal protein L33